MKAASASSTWTTARRPSRLPPLFLLGLLTLLPLRFHAGEPEDFQVIQKLMKEGAFQTALSQAQAYLSTYPASSHRPQVAAWAGGLLAAGGEAEAAVPLLEEAVKGLPPKRQGAAPLDLAQALVSLRRYGDGLEALKAFQPTGEEERARLHRVAAEAYAGLGREEDALKALQAIPKAGRTPQDLLDLGTALAVQGHDDQAVGVLSPLLAKPAPDADPALLRRARMALASSQYRLKSYADALSTLQPLLATPGDVPAALLAAWALHGEGQDDRAYDLVRRALPLKGWEEAAAVAPMRLAAAQGDWGAVLAAAQGVLKKVPDGPAAAEADRLVASALEDRSDYAGAMKALEAAQSALGGRPERMDQALAAAAIAWGKLHDPARAQRWLQVAAQAASTEDEKAQAALALARFLWSKGDPSGALGTIAGLVKDHRGTSSIPHAYLLLGHIRSAEGDWDQGREAFGVVLDSFPDSAAFGEAALSLAESLAAQGRAQEAEKALDDAAATVLDGAQRLREVRLRVSCATALGEWDRAAQALAQAQGWSSSTGAAPSDLYQMALCQLKAGDTSGALAAFSTIPDPRLARAGRFRVAAQLASSGKPKEAWPIWEGLAEEGGEDAAVALWALADSQLASGDAEAGLATLARLADFPEQEPLAVLAQRRLELTLLTRQDTGAALAAVPAFRQAEPVPLGQADALLRTASLRARSENPASASRAYSDYLARFPNGAGAAEATLFLARQASLRSDWASARRLLERAAPSPEVLYLLGQACYQLRDMPSAQEAFERALAVPKGLAEPQALRANYLAGMAARVQGKTSDAVAHLEAFCAASPVTVGGKDDLFGAALWLQNRGRFDPALGALDRLRKTFRDAEIGFQYGYTLELAGRREDALSAYLQVAYTSANAQWALTARYRTAELMASLGRRDDAVALYKELVARSEGTVQGDYAARRLKALEEAPAHNPEPKPQQEDTDHATSPTAH